MLSVVIHRLVSPGSKWNSQPAATMPGASAVYHPERSCQRDKRHIFKSQDYPLARPSWFDEQLLLLLVPFLISSSFSFSPSVPLINKGRRGKETASVGRLHSIPLEAHCLVQREVALPVDRVLDTAKSLHPTQQRQIKWPKETARWRPHTPVPIPLWRRD